MAIHSDLRAMSIEGIEECLAIAEHSVNTRKANGGIYGFPAVLLLFCIIDALSVNTGARAHSLREITSIIPGLTSKQITNLRRWYRDLLAHQAVIAPGTLLSDSDGAPIEFNSAGEPTHIRVVPFYRAVRKRWESFNQRTLNPKVHMENRPTTPMATTVAPSLTGCQHTTSVK
jgi:hypothetical protein